MKSMIFLTLLLWLVLASCSSKEPHYTTVDENYTPIETQVVEEVVEAIEAIEADETVIEENEVITPLSELDESEDIDEEVLSPVLDFSTASFTGNGTEPFWGFSASGSTLILKEASDTWPMNQTIFSSVLMISSGSSVEMSSSDMNITLTLESCSDGMSDIVYDYSSSFSSGSLNYTGCANLD